MEHHGETPEPRDRTSLLTDTGKQLRIGVFLQRENVYKTFKFTPKTATQVLVWGAIVPATVGLALYYQDVSVCAVCAVSCTPPNALVAIRRSRLAPPYILANEHLFSFFLLSVFFTRLCAAFALRCARRLHTTGQARSAESR